MDKKKLLLGMIVQEVGTLSLLDPAQVSNWFETHISVKAALQKDWLGYLPIAHADTLLITAQLRGHASFNDMDEVGLTHLAWKAQKTGTTSVLLDIDADHDCVERLKERMFERSERA
ncbi:unnamed protein product [Cyclocybe aegerita]|uniref:Uncharacterized protein n=1 Tax=Cyclocybe aegerita TaxID=1973307 RepID=A0A8S0VRJ9_CYCAE|nr:unnamed protein product [Cyclocybe aegerita]